MRTFFQAVRTVSAVTLFFFCWTYMSLFQVAAWPASPPEKGRRGDAATGGSRRLQPGQTTPGEKFESALEDIREKVAKAEDKNLKGQDITTEVAEVKGRRAAIDSLDVDLKKEFAATGKKLIDAKLPKEILDRHAKFVKHYEDNLKELKTNLDDVEQAKTKSDRKAKIEKTRLHLEKVRPPRKHIPLDPNKLPNRMVKAKARAPRLKKEEFEKDFPQQKKGGKLAGLQAISATDAHRFTPLEVSRLSNEVNTDFHSALRNPNSALGDKTVLLAFNGPTSDIPLQLSLPSENNRPLPAAGEVCPELVERGLGEGAIPSFDTLSATNYEPRAILLAQASLDIPTADDLAETPEVQFTQDIKDLAAQLNHSPVKIYEWVRNNIEFVPTYGNIQGADMCLQTKQCNSIDTASLLIALLRIANRPARYVYGTIEVPIDKVMNWVGGFTDPRAAISLIASGGSPITGKLSGGKIVAVRMEHTWIETYIPYGNYRGVTMDDSIKTWIPIDGSFKQYAYTNGFDITATVPFSQDAYLSQVQGQNAVHYYQSQIQNYLDANMPDTSIVDVKGYRKIEQETYHFVPSTLPFITIAQLGKFSSIPDGMTVKATFTLSNPATGADVSYTASMPELAGKRITVSYIPATANDEVLITAYGGFLYNVPAYMLNLKPVLRIEGAIKLTGDATTLGSEQTLTLQFTQPGSTNEMVNKKLLAGAYYAIGMDLQGINENVLGKRNYQLNTNILSQTAGTLGKDDLIGEHLFILATTYFLANDKIQKSGAKLFNTVIARTISEGITSFTLSVSYLFSAPKAAMPSDINMDVAMAGVIVSARDGNAAKELAYMDIHGLVGSYHEHDIFEKIDGFSSVSAVKALQTASASGIPIQHINATNINQLLPILQASPEIKVDIQNAVNAGKEITISQANVQINDWNGAGYIVKDPITGAGSYMINGGLAGGDSTTKKDGMQIVEINKEPLGWVKDSIDPQTRNIIATAVTFDIGEMIAQAAVDLIQQYPQPNAYNNVGTCVGVVRKAYMAAGICLDEWSGCPIKESVGWKNGIRWVEGMNGVRYLYDLANKLKINESVSKTRDPLIGDMVFFKYTDDPSIRDHVGVVTSAGDANGTMTFVDATKSGVSAKNMNLQYPSVGLSPTLGRLNHALLVRPCERCYAGELFDGFGTVRNIVAQPQN